MVEVFLRFGNVKDIMIPLKRNIMGWRYAFARFYDCDSGGDLKKNLDNVWISTVMRDTGQCQV